MSLILEAIAYPKGGYWIAHVVDRSFVSYAKELSGLPKALLEQATAQIEIDREDGREPFYGFKPAPPRYLRMLASAKSAGGVPFVLGSQGGVEVRLFPVSGAPTD